MHDERRSVRIEVETDPADSAPLSKAANDSQTIERPNAARPWLPAVLGAVLVVTLIAALVALQPGDGQDATGTERAAPTTAVPTTGPPSRAPPSSAATNDGGLGNAAITRSDLNIGTAVTPTFTAGSVVRGNSSWVGIDSGDLSGSLVTSDDGNEWTAVDTGVEGLLDYGRFSNLIETQAGFGALIRLTDGSGLLQRVDSTDGRDWRIEPNFNLGTPISQRITVHTDDLVGVTNIEPTFEQFLVFLRSALNAPRILDGLQMCGAERLSLEEFQLTDCYGLGSLRITGEDLADSTFFNGIANCAVELSDASPFGSTSLTWRGSDPVVLDKLILRSPVELLDGRVAMIDFGSSSVLGTEPCNGLLGSISERPPAVVIASPDGEIQYIEIEQELFIEPQMVRGISGLNVVVGRSIWNLNPSTEEWSELYPLSDAILSGSDSVALVPHSAEALELIDGHMWVVDIATGRGRLHGVDLPADPSPLVLSVDTEQALIYADSTIIQESLRPLRVATSR